MFIRASCSITASKNLNWLAVIVLSFMPSSQSYGADRPNATKWTEFRGPGGQGYSGARSLPATWSTNQNVAWKTRSLGQGWSSPVVQDNRVYLTSSGVHSWRYYPSLPSTLRVKCYSTTNGQRLWINDVFTLPGHHYSHRKNNYASPTPAVDGEHVFAHFGPLGMACLSTNGQVQWTNTSFFYDSRHGAGGSPTLVEDALIFNAEGRTNPCVVALNKHSGKLLWKFMRPTTAAKKYSFSTPLLVRVKGQPQLISGGSGMLNALDPKTGEEIWRVCYGEGFSVVPRPVFAHGLIFATTGDDTPPKLLAVKADGQGDVTGTHVVWETTRSVPVISSPLTVRDELYMVSDAGVVSCLDARTGKVHYQERLLGSVSASPVFADNKIFIQDEQGLCVVLKPGPALNILAQNHLHQRVLASYAVTEDSIYIRTEGYLYCIRENQLTANPSPPNADGPDNGIAF